MDSKYRLIDKREIDELRGMASLLEHERTGAKVFTIKNNDKNKVFMIAFRTTPADSTGVPHIMEHSVLCGSEKYPIKDPFVELAKGSLNTFLNAMTYPDKTVYPIASVNDKDFMNLMDVYLDSVFFPNAIHEKKIFMQEGWHYEIEGEGADEAINVNGVVYNEMKGAFSNPDSVLERFTLRSLYPDTAYANESGGAPENIPELTFEDFKAFHGKYYHPSNAYIYLYGDMDMEEKLAWIDENYLSRFEREEVDSAIAWQQPYAEEKFDTEYYALAENEDGNNKAYLSENYVLPDKPGRESNLAWQMLDFILLSSPGAVLKEALIKSGIAEDIDGGYMGEICQPYFSVVAKNSEADRLELFRRTIRDTLTELCDKGINKKSLKAALNFIEFKYREEDYGSLPAGLAIGLNILSSWNYDGDPYEYLYYNDTFEHLKEMIDTDYFEELIRRSILDNGFKAVVTVLPKKGLTEEKDAELKEKTEALRRSLDDEEKRELKRIQDELKAYQTEPDDPENLKKLPVLEISDIEKKAETVRAKLKDGIIYTEENTNGIAYMRVIFDTEGFSEEEVQFASLIKDLLGELNTVNHSYTDLFDEILLKTGGISFKLDSVPVRDAKTGEIGYKGICTAEIRALNSRVEDGLKLTAELVNGTIYDDAARIAELLAMAKSRQRAAMDSALHRVAVYRAASYFCAPNRYRELAAGTAYYDFINAAVNLTKQPVHMKRFIKSLKAVAAKLFAKQRVSFALYGDEEARAAMLKAIPEFVAALSEDADNAGVPGRSVAPSGCVNEGLKTSSQVNYDAVCGNFIKNGLSYNGGLQVLRIMLSYEYLWQNLRVLGGAYGCMASFTYSGSSYLVSYRDPQISKTYKIYEELPEYLDNWDGDRDAVKKYIIGAISAIDQPVTHSIKAANDLIYYYFGLTDEDRQRERDEILSFTPEDMRKCAAYVRALLDEGARCTIGSSAKIEKEAEMFKSVRELY